MAARAAITDDEKRAAVARLKAGETQAKVGADLGVSGNAVGQWLKRFGDSVEAKPAKSTRTKAREGPAREGEAPGREEARAEGRDARRGRPRRLRRLRSVVAPVPARADRARRAPAQRRGRLRRAREGRGGRRGAPSRDGSEERGVSDWRTRFLGFVERPPAGWRPRSEMLPVGYDAIPPFVHESGLCVCISIDPSPSGEWLHVSVSLRDRLPRWPEVVRARDAFLGSTVPCVHAVPDSRDHRNYHPYCLHLWARADGMPVIDPTLAEYVAPRSA